MIVFNELTEKNLFLYAAKHYKNPKFSDIDDFYEDLKRFKYIKRLLNQDYDKIPKPILIATKMTNNDVVTASILLDKNFKFK